MIAPVIPDVLMGHWPDPSAFGTREDSGDGACVMAPLSDEAGAGLNDENGWILMDTKEE